MAFFHPPAARQPIFLVPGIVFALIALLAAIHLARVLIPITDDQLLPFGFVPARYSEGASLALLVIPLVSHMFLHGSVMHVVMCCLFLLAFAPVVVRWLGTLRFLAFYLACGVASALTLLACLWGSYDVAIGASGGISGLMAAAARMLRWPNQPAGTGLAPLWSRPVLSFSAVWLISNVIFGVMGIGTGPNEIVAWQGHMGGYLFGLVAIGWFEKRGQALRLP
jgi:membrane associated rhomboid family serine protease